MPVLADRQADISEKTVLVIDSAEKQQTQERAPADEFSKTALNLVSEHGDFNLDRANALLAKGIADWRMSRYDQALAQYRAAIEIFEACNHQKGLADSLSHIGVVHWSLGDYMNALKCHQQSLALRQTIGDVAGIAGSLANLGIVYTQLGDYPKALDYHHRSLVIRQALDDKYGVAKALGNIGNVYGNLADCLNALRCHQECLAMMRLIDNTVGIASALNNVGIVYEKMLDYPSALAYHQECLAMMKLLDDRVGIAASFKNIGNVYAHLADYNNALKFQHESLAISRAIGNKQGVAESLFYLGLIYLSDKQYEPAFQSLNESLKIADELGLKKERFEILERLAFLYAETGQFEKAYQTHTEFHKAEKEIYNAQTQQQLSNLRVRFETEQAQKDAELQRVKNVELAAALTEAEFQKQRAEEANRFKTDLLGIAAHDLRNPLQSIMGFAQLLSMKFGDNEKITEYAATIERSSKRMLKIISDLLTTLRSETNQIQLQKSPTNLSELLAFVVHNNSAQAAAKLQSFDCRFEENAIADIDAEKMTEVLDNIISNAIKYSPRETRISVSVKQTTDSHKQLESSLQNANGYVLIAVKDEGLGLSADDIKKMFGKFQRLSALPTGNESSTGLGLSIVKQLVELHGGIVWAESDGKGKGSTFFIELPAYAF